MIQSVVIGLLHAADVNSGTPITITEPIARCKDPNSHGICVSPMQKSIDKALQFVQQRTALFFTRTPINNNNKHSLFIDKFSRLDGDLQAVQSEHNTHN